MCLLLYFFLVAEPSKPFVRPFRISDTTIQFPFATEERVTDNELYVLSCLVPTAVIFLWCEALFRLKKLTRYQSSRLLNISLLGLWIALSVNGVVTDILKAWIARHRPDFLARCVPAVGTPADALVGIEVCTAPLGGVLLIDGMKSTPSGHSSISFSGLFYLSLWLFRQVGGRHLGYQLAAWLPSLLAVYIALSRTQDYRHHYSDVVLGSAIGIAMAWMGYRRSASEEKEEEVLPK